MKNNRKVALTPQAHLGGLLNTVKVIRNQALNEDGVQDGPFVVFSKNNKYVPALDRAVAELQEARGVYSRTIAI